MRVHASFLIGDSEYSAFTIRTLAAFKGVRTNLEKPLVLWLTDLHLDRSSDTRKIGFYEEIRASTASVIVITGDISVARHLPLHLAELAAAASPRKVFFTLGNHDFFGSSIAKVEGVVAGVCRSQVNLQHLGHGEIIRLNSDTALVGHRGWGDGRMGWGARTFARNPDFAAIADFRGLSRGESFALLRKLGQESATYLRSVLPYALSCFEHVVVATHVPTFTQAAFYRRKPCDNLRQPFYSNLSAGGVILRIAQRFPKSKVTVLAGHTHCAAQFQALPNLALRVGGARPGFPGAQGLFEVSAAGLAQKSGSPVSRCSNRGGTQPPA